MLFRSRGKAEREDVYDRSKVLAELDNNNRCEKPDKINKKQIRSEGNNEKFEDVYD